MGQVKQRKKRRIKKIVARYTVLIERDEETGQIDRIYAVGEEAIE